MPNDIEERKLNVFLTEYNNLRSELINKALDELKFD